MKAAEFKTAKRQQTSLLAPLEYPTLQWLARNMPSWVNSDHLTALALLAMFVAGLCFWAAKSDIRWLLGVPVALALNWFGDSLDGTLARFRNQQRPRYGFYVDHLCDSLSALFLCGGMALGGLMSVVIAAGVLVSYLLLSIEAYLTSYCLGKFRISFSIFSPTELRVLVAIGTLLLMRWPYAIIAGEQYLSLDVGGVCAIIGMSAMFLWAAFSHTRQLYNEERIG